MLVHPNFDPVAFSIGPLAVRWYGLMYLLGFGASWWLGRLRIARGLAPITRTQFEDLMFFGIVGVILGGRLGYVLFYQPEHYFSHPLDIFAVWRAACRFMEDCSAWYSQWCSWLGASGSISFGSRTSSRRWC